jgi:hypothetical protein
MISWSAWACALGDFQLLAVTARPARVCTPPRLRRIALTRPALARRFLDPGTIPSRVTSPLPSSHLPRPQYKPNKSTQGHVPITVISPTLTAQQLLLPLQIGIVPPDLVAVLLGLQQRREVDARPHLLAAHLDLLALADEQLPPAVGHDPNDAEEVVHGLEAAGGDVALRKDVSGQGRFRWVERFRLGVGNVWMRGLVGRTRYCTAS